jgi:hypothetical protein
MLSEKGKQLLVLNDFKFFKHHTSKRTKIRGVVLYYFFVPGFYRVRTYTCIFFYRVGTNVRIFCTYYSRVGTYIRPNIFENVTYLWFFFFFL